MCLVHAQITSFFFFNDTATTEIYTLSLHDALPISYFLCPGNFSTNSKRRDPSRTSLCAVLSLFAGQRSLDTGLHSCNSQIRLHYFFRPKTEPQEELTVTFSLTKAFCQSRRWAFFPP